MSQIRNFGQVHTVLGQFYGKHTVGPYTLDRMRQLMDYLGNPQDTLRVIHVAGTSGKGSTAYYISSLLEQSGATVGMTVSPFIKEVNERVQINHRPLPEGTFCAALTEFLQLVEQSKIESSYFEVMVAMAYWYFAREKVDYAVIEVGLGGLLDSTNIVSAEDKVCVITDIGFDHTDILGKTLPEIAAQKAGIIQRGNQVFVRRQADEIMQVIEKQVATQHATLHVINRSATNSYDSLPLFQRRNFGLAEAVVDYVLERGDEPRLTEVQKDTASQVSIPGRMEEFIVKGKTVIFDGAHNEQKMMALMQSVAAKYPDQSVATLLSVSEAGDDRWERTGEVVAKKTDYVIATSFQLEQDAPKVSVPPARVAAHLRSRGYGAVEIEPSLRLALQKLLARPEPLLLITGSLYLLGQAKLLLLEQA